MKWELGGRGLCKDPRCGRGQAHQMGDGVGSVLHRGIKSLPTAFLNFSLSHIQQAASASGLLHMLSSLAGTTFLQIFECWLFPVQCKYQCLMKAPSPYPSYLDSIPLSCIALYNTISSHHSTFSACSPLEWKTLRMGTLNGIHSVSPQDPDPPLASSAEEMNVPSLYQVIFPKTLFDTAGKLHIRISTLSESRRICLGK